MVLFPRRCIIPPVVTIIAALALISTTPTSTQARVIANSGGKTASYTSRDDFSWAITRPDQLFSPYHQKLYNDYMEQCNDETQGQCQSGEEYRLRMNRDQPGGVYNYTETGYLKMRAPEALINVITDFYERNKDKESIEWKSINPYHNMWEAPPYFISLEDPHLGGGEAVQRVVWTEARQVLEEWTGQRLSPVSMYGVRVYKHGSILAPHVDRMPLVTSCIINIAQEEMEEPWPLEVFNHDGVAENVTMEPGDMVLYESHSVIHGRPFPMKGKAFVNVFLHFEPIGPLDDIEKCGPQEDGLPPYLISGGQWEDEWRKTSPDGWKVSTDVGGALLKGDVRTLEYHAYHNPEFLHKKDYNGWAPVHEAAWKGDLDGLQFLFENGATVQDRIGKDGEPPGPNVLELVKQSPVVTLDHPVVRFLLDAMAESEL